jgi:hypothetical protein
VGKEYLWSCRKEREASTDPATHPWSAPRAVMVADILDLTSHRVEGRNVEEGHYRWSNTVATVPQT